MFWLPFIYITCYVSWMIKFNCEQTINKAARIYRVMEWGKGYTPQAIFALYREAHPYDTVIGLQQVRTALYGLQRRGYVDNNERAGEWFKFDIDNDYNEQPAA